MPQCAVIVTENYLHLTGIREKDRIRDREIAVVVAAILILFMSYYLLDLRDGAQLSVFAVYIGKRSVYRQRFHGGRVARHEHAREQQEDNTENYGESQTPDCGLYYPPDLCPSRFVRVAFIFFLFVFFEHFLDSFLYLCVRKGSVELHVAVLYPSYAAQYQIECIREQCGKQEADENKTYPIKYSYRVGVAV